ncbi:hypothetical protein [Pseudoalteromonas pernae]|uniref:hypothetical protein n=1 Tax=Pseudoalteromonas pernae TaxID=3118054 RepID=UPI0032422A50
MKKVIVIASIWLAILLINWVVFGQYEAHQQEQIFDLSFTNKTIPFFLLAFITIPLAIFLTFVIITVTKTSKKVMDVSNIPVTQLQEMVALAFNTQQYQQAIDTFDEISEALADNKEKLADFHTIRAFKIIALGEIDGDYAAEVKALEAQWGDSFEVMYPNCYMFISMQFYEYVVMMETKSREVLSCKLHCLMQLKAFDAYQQVKAIYDSVEPNPREQQITIAENGKTVTYTLNDIVAFNLNNDLPNNNVYINFTIEKDSTTFEASIPGQGNDGICAEGYLRLSDKEEFTFDIERNQVKTNFMLSPSGTLVTGEGFRINIPNVSLLSELFSTAEQE